MLEFSRDEGPAGDCWRLGVAGDSFNTAVYLARLGVPVEYLSALGADPMSMRIRDAIRREGLGETLLLEHPARRPGLYLIETPPGQDRRFHYWRDSSAARALFECPGIETALAGAARARLLYLSGITLSLFGAAQQQRLRELAATVRAGGGLVA